MEARRQWDDIFMAEKGKYCQQKLSFKNEGEMKIFPDKQKLREFITSRLSLKETQKGALRLNERTLDTNSKSCEEMKNNGKGNYTEYINQYYYCTLGL